MINEICICDKVYKRYDDLYFVTNDGIVALIEFDENDSLKRYFRMNQETTKFGYKRVKIHHSKSVLVHRMVFGCWGNEKLNPTMVTKNDTKLQNYFEHQTTIERIAFNVVNVE